MRRLLFLNNQGLQSFGGGVSILRHLVTELAGTYQVTVASFDAAAPGWPGVTQHQLPMPAAPPGPFWRAAPLWRAAALWRGDAGELARRADIVICLDCHFALTLWGVSRRLLYLSLSCIPAQERAAGAAGATVAQYAVLERMIAARADRVIVASEAHAALMRRHEGLRRPLDILHPCLPGVGPGARARGGDGPVHIVAAGRLEPGKGFREVVELAAALRDVPCRFSIFGDGPERDALRGLSERLGVADRVTLRGPSAGLGEALEAADLFLHASPFESFGMVVFEAMRAGVPVIGRAGDEVVVGYREVLRDGIDGVLVRFPVARAAAQLRPLLGDAAARRRMGEAAAAGAAAWLATHDYAAAVRRVLAAIEGG